VFLLAEQVVNRTGVDIRDHLAVVARYRRLKAGGSSEYEARKVSTLFRLDKGNRWDRQPSL
jgi:hypothetical protein